jgi:oxygen-independent coproporphyrinogen-3 oxidase
VTNCYIHIPFCDLKCKYCRFASIWKIQNLHIEKYVSFLCKEIKALTPSPSPLREKGIIVKTIYFWWWTPSVLDEKNLKKIFNILQEKFIFSDNTEITIESTPNNINLENLSLWQKLWINRISIWIQTFNEKSLQEIWRWQKWDIKKCLTNLEKFFKFKKTSNINFDFIIGLPYVKPGEILENIKQVVNNYNFVKHISVYMLEEYYSSDKIIETKYDKITYPKNWKKLWLKEEDFLGEYLNIKNFLLENWFINYEISNFAKSWYICKHNKWYWEHKEVLAFWMWAWWLLKSPLTPIFKGGDKMNIWYIRYLNADNFKDYYEWKKIFEEILNEDDIFLEKLMFWLRTNWIKKEIYKKLNQEKIKYFIDNWYLYIDYDIIKLTDKWVLILDYILKEII